MSGQGYRYRVLICQSSLRTRIYSTMLSPSLDVCISPRVISSVRHLFLPLHLRYLNLQGNVPPLFHCFDKFPIALQNPEIILIFHLLITSCLRKPCSMVAWSLRCLPFGGIRSAVYRRCRCRRKVYCLAWCSYPFSRCSC
jgi:hypothetical protein